MEIILGFFKVDFNTGYTIIDFFFLPKKKG